MPQPVVGFCGIGNMGMPMATNLVRKGFPVIVYDLRPEPLQTLRELGCRLADCNRTVGEQADIVFSMVMSPTDTDALVFGKDGLAEGMAPGKLLVLTSTLGPEVPRRVAERLQPLGIDVLDAPVTGGVPAAVAGKLNFLVGGSEAILERCRPLFMAMGQRVIHMGALGTGQMGKILNNLVCLTNMAVLAEGVELGNRSGLDTQKMLDLFRIGSANSWAVDQWEWVAQCLTTPKGVPQRNVIDKDLGLALAVGRDVGVELPLTAAAAAIIEYPSALRWVGRS